MDNSNFQNIHEIGQDTFNRVNDLGHHVIGSICDMAVPVYNSYTNSNSGNPIPSPKWYPYCDVKHTEDNIKLLLTMPGVKKENIKAKISGNHLNISGVTSMKDDNEWVHVKEKNYNRNFNVPSNTKMSDVNIKYIDGILKIIVQKHEDTDETQIPID